MSKYPASNLDRKSLFDHNLSQNFSLGGFNRLSLMQAPSTSGYRAAMPMHTK